MSALTLSTFDEMLKALAPKRIEAPRRPDCILLNPHVFNAIVHGTPLPPTQPPPMSPAGAARTDREIWWRWATTRNKPSRFDALGPGHDTPFRRRRAELQAARWPFAGMFSR